MELRRKQRLDYKQMSYGERILCRKENIDKREVLPELYNVERIVSRKDFKNKGTLYLVKWEGYGDDECTWEPHQHLPREVIDNFLNPTPSEESNQIYSRHLKEAVRKRLKSTSETFSLNFPHELYRYAFGASADRLVEKEDFAKLQLGENWDKLHRDNGVGIGLKFPVRISSTVVFTNNYVPVEGQMVNKKILGERLKIVSSAGVVFAL